MKNVTRFLGKVLLIAFITVVLLEASLGIYFHFKDKHADNLDARDYPYLYFVFNQHEGSNQFGMKTDKPIEKDPTKYRIILTGGSVARGQGDPDKSIAADLERELNQTYHTNRYEVINAGMSSYVIEQEFIFIQLVLQQYKPDMIIGLDGFNDLYSYYLNRPYEEDWLSYPHQWSDFKVIEANSNKEKFFSRFTSLFRNISRAVGAVEHRNKSKNFNWQGISQDELKSVSSSYWNTAQDIFDFCKSKGISYVQFLQPVRDFTTNSTPLIFNTATLNELYSAMDHESGNYPFANSQTHIFLDKPQVFTDFCHLNPEGNELLAHQMEINLSHLFDLSADSSKTVQ